MTIQELTFAVQGFIATDKSDASFDLLAQQIPILFPEHLNDFTLLKSRFEQTKDDFTVRGIITNDEFNTRIAQINLGVLEFLKNIAEPPPPVASTTVQSSTGKILHNVPAEMKLGLETRCVVRIAYDEITLTKDFTKSDDTVVQDIRIDEVMHVELVDFNEQPSFSFRTITNNEQFLDKETFTQWLFMVKPLREGTFPITIKISVIEIVDGKERKRDIVLEKNVLIHTQAVEPAPAPFIDTNIAVNSKQSAVSNQPSETSEPIANKSKLMAVAINVGSVMAMVVAVTVGSYAIFRDKLGGNDTDKFNRSERFETRNLNKDSLAKVDTLNTPKTPETISHLHEEAHTFKKIPNAVAIPISKSDVKNMISSHRVNLDNKKQFKDLFVFVDDQIATNIYSSNGYVTGFEFSSNKKTHALRFLVGSYAGNRKSGKYKFVSCKINDFEVTDYATNVSVCDLR